jgi:hypothetical protein
VASTLQSSIASLNKYWLGGHNTPPTTDNNGDPLQFGAEYEDTSQSPAVLMIYTADGWIVDTGTSGSATLAAVQAAESAAQAATAQAAAAGFAGAASASADNAAASVVQAAASVSQAQAALSTGNAVIAKAQAWATQLGDKVQGADYSAKYYAGQSANYAANAQNYLNSASRFATNAGNSASAASNSATTATNAAATATAAAALVDGFVTGSETDAGALQDDDGFAVARDGVLHSTKLSVMAESMRAGLLNAENNLNDVADAAEALANVGGAPLAGFLSQLVTASSTSSLTVSTTFSFTPTVDGKVAVMAQGGAYGYTTGSMSQEFTTVNGATSLGSQGNTSASNLAMTSAQFAVTAGVPVTLTLSQTAPTGTSSNQMASLFIFLPK